MGGTDRVCVKVGWPTSLLRQLPKTGPGDDKGTVLDTGHGQMYRLAGKHYDISALDAK